MIIYLVLWYYGWVFLGLETADVRRRWTWVPFITEGYSRLDHQISSCAWAVTIGPGARRLLLTSVLSSPRSASLVTLPPPPAPLRETNDKGEGMSERSGGV